MPRARDTSSLNPAALGFTRLSMLSLLLVTLGLSTVGTYAKPNLRATGDLEASLSTPTDKVTSVSDLKVIAAVKNTGDKNLTILKFGTALDDEHHSRPSIVSKDGKEVPSTGTEVVRTPPSQPPALSININVDGSYRFPSP